MSLFPRALRTDVYVEPETGKIAVRMTAAKELRTFLLLAPDEARELSRALARHLEAEHAE